MRILCICVWLNYFASEPLFKLQRRRRVLFPLPPTLPIIHVVCVRGIDKRIMDRSEAVTRKIKFECLVQPWKPCVFSTKNFFAENFFFFFWRGILIYLMGGRVSWMRLFGSSFSVTTLLLFFCLLCLMRFRTFEIDCVQLYCRQKISW